jgi:hypothetical protein
MRLVCASVRWYVAVTCVCAVQGLKRQLRTMLECSMCACGFCRVFRGTQRRLGIAQVVSGVASVQQWVVW